LRQRSLTVAALKHTFWDRLQAVRIAPFRTDDAVGQIFPRLRGPLFVAAALDEGERLPVRRARAIVLARFFCFSEKELRKGPAAVR
jgi:hypothetical protein